MRFKGSIVIGDPSYFMKSDEDWQKCEYGERMDLLGFTDFMWMDFEEDAQGVKEEGSGQLLGGISVDSGRIVVVYLEELKAYREDYEKAFYSKTNRAIIPDFDGEVSSEEVEDNEDDTYLSVYGTGNISFRSMHVPKKELYALHNS